MILIIVINFKQFLNEDLTWNLQVDQRYFPIITQKVIEINTESSGPSQQRL